uniref:NADH-ubiquinone oxidoreductase chain 5 n=1 Tax=Phrynoglossus myanhessei TaxID=2798809 RepID=A0A8A0WW70_9NEOB|nr:NADH dehydrogenase subunit 5 [Phrynoglossus myanhessei]QSQ72199.1 NADH dehydrogenase subunit 5 [Phrynoglossus myanhessei]
MAHNTSNTLLSLSLVPLFVIVWSLIFLSTKKPEKMVSSVKYAFLSSLLPLVGLLMKGPNYINDTQTNINWINIDPASISITMKFDLYQIIFTSTALFVTWSIMEFSLWYMETDPAVGNFFKKLLFFLLTMMIIISAGNLTVLFVGWEGVGIMSFLLIGWYHARWTTALAALQAVIYNRIGDMGFMLAFCWMVTKTLSTNVNFLCSMNPHSLIVFGIILAAASKSAQFMMHPWLASAMEGPTPVSALLHSSTMVVAGIFLLIRVHPLIAQHSMTLTICLCLGAITSLFAATTALMQNDIKKIIAYSTSSQLGLMMVAIGVNMPNLAFFHICMHAFFKAMLFLCSGVMIHNLNNDQDIRHMGGLQKVMPVTTSCMTIGTLALMGTPFLTGFYSKDAIIEAVNTSYVNSTALIMTLVATAFTAVYSLRLIYFVSMNQPRFNSLLVVNEPHLTTFPIIRLAIGSILAGPMYFYLLFPSSPTIHTMPVLMKIAALTVTIVAFVLAAGLAWKTWTTPPHHNPYIMLSKELDSVVFTAFVHRSFSVLYLNSAWTIITHAIENILFKLFAEYPAHMQINPISIVRATQKGFIKLYLSALFINMALVLIMFILFF